MTFIMDSATRLLERALRSRLGWINIPRIAIRIFVELSRIPWANLAAHMAATRAFFGARGKDRGTEVTVAVDPLAHWPMNEILAAGGRRHRDGNHPRGAELEVRGPGE